MSRNVIVIASILCFICQIGFAEDFEISYDDGSPTKGTSTSLDSTIYTVRFTPPSGNDWIIKTASFYIYSGSGIARARLFDDYSNEPGPQLFPGVDIDVTTPPYHWFDVDLLSYDVHVNDDFYLGFEMPDHNNAPFVGVDYVENDRNWIYTPENNWYERNMMFFFMRVVVTDQAGVEHELIPARVMTLSCIPDPFSTSTTIDFSFSEPGDISLTIWDATGRQVNTLINGYLEPGKHFVQWDGTDNDNNRLPSGVYLVRLSTPQGSLNHKVLLIDSIHNQ